MWRTTLGRLTVVPVTDGQEALAWLDQQHAAWTAETAPHLLVVDSVATLLAPLLSANGSFRGASSRRRRGGPTPR